MNEAYLGASMVNAVGPVHLGSTFIESMDALMKESVSDKLFGCYFILANDHLA